GRGVRRGIGRRIRRSVGRGICGGVRRCRGRSREGAGRHLVVLAPEIAGQDHVIGRAGDGGRAVAKSPTVTLLLPDADVGAPFDLDGRTGDWASPLEVVTRPRVGIAPFGG